MKAIMLSFCYENWIILFHIITLVEINYIFSLLRRLIWTQEEWEGSNWFLKNKKITERIIKKPFQPIKFKTIIGQN